MNKVILSAGSVWQTHNGIKYESIHDGEGENSFEQFKKYYEDSKLQQCLETFLLLNDGTRVTLPIEAMPYLLPDRSGVVVIFSVDLAGNPTESLPAGFPDVHAPHNAVIFNSDGGLRCVINVHSKVGAYIQQTSTDVITHKSGPYGQVLSEDFPEPIIKFGVLVGDHPSSSPDWFYELDTHTGDLVGLGKWKRY